MATKRKATPKEFFCFIHLIFIFRFIALNDYWAIRKILLSIYYHCICHDQCGASICFINFLIPIRFEKRNNDSPKMIVNWEVFSPKKMFYIVFFFSLSVVNSASCGGGGGIRYITNIH